MQINFLYLVPKPFGGAGYRAIREMRVVGELLKEVYAAESRGVAPFNIGLVYGTARPVTIEDQETLGIVEFA